MKNEAFKYKGRVVWRFDYHWTDALNNVLGDADNVETYLGTKKDFDRWTNAAKRESRGFTYWGLKKRHATAEEYADYISWHH